MVKMYYKRDLEVTIDRYLGTPEIIAVFGPRQVGKTTLLKRIHEKMPNSVFLTFEDIETKLLFEEDIKSFISLYVEPYDAVFIDEFQYAGMGGKHLKFIYDTTQKKIFISGSSAMELSVNAIKYLSGRIFVFNLYSFSFGEFLLARDPALYALYEQADETLSEIVSQKIYGYFDEYILYGGYPRVILSKTVEEKIEVLKNLLSIYLLRDIKEVANITDEARMYKLLKALSLQIANIITYSDLASLIDTSAPKLKEYLSVFENVFLTKTITPFFTNKRLELVKNPEIFFFDMGLRNVIIRNFNPLEDRVDKGDMLENFVFRELIDAEVKYYRTKNGAEVDFIVEEKIPVEVKSHITDMKISRSYHHFLETYKPAKGYVLNFNQRGKKVFRDTEIFFLPHFLAHRVLRDV